MKPRHAKILINAGAGGQFDDTLRQRLSEIFQAAGARADIVVVEAPDEVGPLAQAAAQEDYEMIVAGGGDGTISLVASALIDSGKSFGVLPLGTLNHFAKDLRIPTEFEEAAQNLVSGSPVQVDVGEVNGRTFLNNSTLGLYPTLVREREKQQRLGWGKWPAFVWAAIAALRRYPFVSVRVSVDGKPVTTRTPFVFVGNNQYVMERLNIGTRERLDGGELSLYMSRRTGRFGLVRLALRALLGRLHLEKDFMAMSAREVTIATKSSRARVAMDGEVDILQTPLEYRIRPRALSVVVPDSRRD
ncbi:MAG TPA: diacylglycerol kinase family protein [Pyrinomonadaceae bacterium]|nr:diacylglycerol kinase family protein [Pyrinomonadaceae bacterium]